MAENKSFSIGFIKAHPSEHIFLSVTPGFELGPGIQRDGITKPRMTDPHHVAYVRGAYGLPPIDRDSKHPTDDPFLQRAGTWTLYHHLREFVETCGSEWLVVGCQSCGDLTMNPWHVAYIGHSHLAGLGGKLCALRTEEDPAEQHEPLTSRVYHSLVKWQPKAADLIGATYEFLDLRIDPSREGVSVVLDKSNVRESHSKVLVTLPGYDSNKQDVSGFVEFTLSGKPIVEAGVELSLSNAIDRFQDVRHVFNLPAVACHGVFDGQDVDEINFGEYQLFERLNERRAALQSAVLIDLKIGTSVAVTWEELRKVLLKRHFREVDESPMRRGQFRKVNGTQAEIFYPHNVYPFGVLGLASNGLVCLASGGLSGRVGNTLEGITRIMYDFFGCVDAMVLDEGLDTFQMVNPEASDGKYRYDNYDILNTALAFSWRVAQAECQQAKPHDGYLMSDWPLNKSIFSSLEEASNARGREQEHDEILAVRPHRCQMRSVLIFAVRRGQGGQSNAGDSRPAARVETA